MNWSRKLTEYEQNREDLTFFKAGFDSRIMRLIQCQENMKESYPGEIKENIESAKHNLAEYEKVKAILGCDPGPCEMRPERLQAVLNDLGFK